MGFSTGVPTATTSTETHKDWAGNRTAATDAGVYFTKDSNNNWFIKSTDANNPYLNNVWYGGGLDFLQGTEFADGIIGADGRLYTRSQILGGDYKDDRVNKFLAASAQEG